MLWAAGCGFLVCLVQVAFDGFEGRPFLCGNLLGHDPIIWFRKRRCPSDLFPLTGENTLHENILRAPQICLRFGIHKESCGAELQLDLFNHFDHRIRSLGTIRQFLNFSQEVTTVWPIHCKYHLTSLGEKIIIAVFYMKEAFLIESLS
ncbi:hypothetical protein BVY04_02550 [bacterium M21]|nr:hypothetical protein BVY04_02550 [bacterium M21]